MYGKIGDNMKLFKLTAIIAAFTFSLISAVDSVGARLACLCDDNSIAISHDAANLDANYGNNRWCRVVGCAGKGFTKDPANYGFLNLEAIVSGMSSAQLKEQIAKNGVNEVAVGSAGHLKSVLQAQLGGITTFSN